MHCYISSLIDMMVKMGPVQVMFSRGRSACSCGKPHSA